MIVDRMVIGDMDRKIFRRDGKAQRSRTDVTVRICRIATRTWEGGPRNSVEVVMIWKPAWSRVCGRISPGNAHFIVRVAVVVVFVMMPVFVVRVVRIAAILVDVNFVARFVEAGKSFNFLSVARLGGRVCGEVGGYEGTDQGVGRRRVNAGAASRTSRLKFKPTDGTSS